jgi:hypothetical protein
MNDETMDNQQETFKVSEADIGWLAGIVDGEGSISLAFGMVKANQINNMSPRIEVANTDKEMIEKFVRIVHGLGGGIHVTTKKVNQHRPPGVIKKRPENGFKSLYYAKAVGFKRTNKILKAIYPHLVGNKKERAGLVMKFIESRMQKTSGDRCGWKYRYDEEDLKTAIEISKTMRTKFTSVLEGLLNDCTRAQQKAA